MKTKIRETTRYSYPGENFDKKDPREPRELSCTRVTREFYHESHEGTKMVHVACTWSSRARIQKHKFGVQAWRKEERVHMESSENSRPDSFTALATAFSDRIQELKRFTYLRIEGWYVLLLWWNPCKCQTFNATRQEPPFHAWACRASPVRNAAKRLLVRGLGVGQG